MLLPVVLSDRAFFNSRINSARRRLYDPFTSLPSPPCPPSSPVSPPVGGRETAFPERGPFSTLALLRARSARDRCASRNIIIRVVSRASLPLSGTGLQQRPKLAVPLNYKGQFVPRATLSALHYARAYSRRISAVRNLISSFVRVITPAPAR